MSDATISLLILAAVVAAFVWNRLPVEFVAISSALALYFTGVLDLRDALAGFGDPAVILIAALFVVSEGLDATGVTTWVGQTLVAKAGDGVGRLLLLTGSPVNVVISEAAQAAGVGSLGFAEFAVVGVPVVLGTLLIVWAFGQRLLPDRVSDELPPDLSGHASILVRQYSLDNVAHLRVRTGSPMIGSPRAAIDLTEYPGTRLVTVMDAESWQPASAGAIHPGDRLTLVGDPDTSARFAADHGLEVENVRTGAQVEQSLMGKEMGAAEVVIPPRSRYVGRPVRPSQVIRDRIVVLAVERSGKDLGPDVARLAAGDVLLVEGSWPALDEAARDHDLLVVDSPALVRRQAVPLGAGSIPAIGVLAAMVVLLATGLVPPVVAALLAAGAMILFRAVTVQQAYRGVSWSTVLLVAGMLPMSIAIRTSGAGEQVATLIVDAVRSAGPVMLLVALFVITVIFGQLISNTATALVMIPIAVSAAAQLDISARPVLMSLCVGAAVAFLTPVATPANMMVMGPAGYRFADYWKLGLPLVGLFFVVAVGLVPLVWQF